MKMLDLADALKQYKDGWVAIDERQLKVVAHEKSYEEVAKRVKDKSNIFVMPASDNYFGYVM